VRPIISRSSRRIFVAAALIIAIQACGGSGPEAPLPLSADERYLVDAYVRVRKASALYPYQRPVADSLLAGLAGEVDTLRVARTIAALNTDPARWSLVLETIEKTLSPPPDSTSEARR